MKRFFCQCGQEVFFHNLTCEKCGRDLAFDPSSGTMWSGEVHGDGRFHTRSASSGNTLSFRLCENRDNAVSCNWVLSEQEAADECQCISCRTTRTIPDLSILHNRRRWRLLERAKRNVVYTLLDLKLFAAFGSVTPNLQFDFLEDQRSNPKVALEHVLTGHHDGLITINAAEADEGFLHTMKEQMSERYRTVLGHFRHEIGHFYWCRLIASQGKEEAFRQVFGDERQNYDEALQYYYDKGRHKHWMNRFITPYASSHPHEDWAETWAHYLHMSDTLETAVSYGLSVYEPKKNDFDDWFNEWGRVSQIMNALNRSMGMADPYPFVLSPAVQGKLRFIDELLDESDLTQP